METYIESTETYSTPQSCPTHGLDCIVSWRGTHDLGPFLFSYPYPVLYCGNRKTPDMTLIAAVWSPEGFAIAADGFQVETNQPPIYNAQKIFHTPFHNGTGFAYACAGTCRIGFQSGRYFDFFEAVQRVTNDLAFTSFPDDPADYFNEIGRILFEELAYSLADPKVSESKLLFVGYGNGVPIWAELIFSNTGTRFYPHNLALLQKTPRQFMVFAGSTMVYGDMQIAGKLSQPMCLQEAIDMVKEYAMTCVENNTTIEDCTNLGGDVHVASVTKEGFSWVIEPIIDRTEKEV